MNISQFLMSTYLDNDVQDTKALVSTKDSATVMGSC